MKTIRITRYSLLSLTVSLFFAVTNAQAQHAGDVIVGVSAAGQLKIGGFIPDEHVVVLPPVSGLLQGWANNNPGFDHLVNAEPDNDNYPLQPGAQIRLQALAIDPALRAISPSFVIIDAPGESMSLGTNTLHTHPTWHINSQDANFDAMKTLWRGTFKLIDQGSTAYIESAPFTFYFSNVVCLTADVNDDGVVNGEDIQTFLDVLFNPPDATDVERCAADANRDGYVTIDDVDAFVTTLLNP